MAKTKKPPSRPLKAPEETEVKIEEGHVAFMLGGKGFRLDFQLWRKVGHGESS